jgi:preprotein translocase subunit SecE
MSILTNNALITYFRGAKEELEKVTWPSRKQVIIYSAIVMVVTLVWAAYFGALDFVLNLGLQAILGA